MSDHHENGRRHGIKQAVAFVHSYAHQMNDPSARAALLVCADRLGCLGKRGQLSKPTNPQEPTVADPHEHLRRLREAHDKHVKHGLAMVGVRVEDLAWALKLVDEAREALRPFAEVWRYDDAPHHFRDATYRLGDMTLNLMNDDMRRAAAIADKIGE